MEKENINIISSINSSTINGNTSSINKDYVSVSLERYEDYAATFGVVVERIYDTGCVTNIKASFSTLLFEKIFFASIKYGYRQYSLSRLVDHLYSLEAEIENLSGERRNIDNDIFVAITFGKIDDYAPAIIVLLK